MRVGTGLVGHECGDGYNFVVESVADGLDPPHLSHCSRHTT